jgi:hypothetical protein
VEQLVSDRVPDILKNPV